MMSFFAGDGRVVQPPLIGQHADDLPGGLQSLGVGLLGGNAHRLVRRLDDDLVGAGQAGDHGAPADDGEGLRLVLGKAAHPLVEDGGQLEVAEAGVAEVVLGQALQALDGGHVLDQVARLAVAQGDRPDALLQGQQALDDGHGVADARRHQRAGQRPEGLAVDGHAVLLVQPAEPIDVLPVGQRLPQGDVLGVGDVVGDAAALEAGEAAGQGDLGQQPGVGRAVADLDRPRQRLGHQAAVLHPVVDGRKTVEHRHARGQRLLDPLGRFLVAVLPRIGVDGRGQQVGPALGLQVLEQLDVLGQQGHAGPRLEQQPAGGGRPRAWPGRIASTRGSACW